jgi:hypothetical protein
MESLPVLWVILALTLFSGTFLHAQSGLVADQGARSLALSGISATLNSSDAVFNNFSNITDTQGFGAIASSLRRFNLSELSVASIGVYNKLGNFGHLGLNFSHYGFEDFKNQRFSLLYARKLSQIISVSANFDFNTIRISEFGSSSSIGFGIGISGLITDNLKYGISIINPEKLEIAEATELSPVLKFGLSFALSRKITGYTEIEKIVDEDINIIVGIEYLMEDKLSLRMGVHTNPGGFSFGLQYRIHARFIIDGAASYNTLLGLTPGLSLKYNIQDTNQQE